MAEFTNHIQADKPSPNPDYPQDIEVIEENFDLISCGKNLLNITTDFPKTSGSLTLSKNEDKTLQLTGNKTEEGWENLNFKLKEINFKKGNTYIIAKGITLKLAKKDDPTFYKNQSNKFVVTDDNIYCTSAYVSKYMVDNYNEKIYPYIAINDTFNELDFEPYIESRLPVKIPEGEFACKINDDVKDKLNIRFNESDGNYHLYLKKNVGKVVLDGSESYYTSEIYFFPDTITFRTTIEGDINHSRQSLCSHFIQTTNWNDISNGVDGKYQLYDTNGYFWFVVNKNIATNIDDLKTWLSENNVTIDYQLAEPYEIDLGKVEMPLSYYPITNVYTTCSLQPTIEVEYYRDFKNTIVELQDNQKEMEEQLADSIDRIEALETAIQSLQTSSIESEVVE